MLQLFSIGCNFIELVIYACAGHGYSGRFVAVTPAAATASMVV